MERVTDFSQIEKHLKVGCMVLVKAKNDSYSVLTPHRYDDDLYRRSSWESAKEWTWRFVGQTQGPALSGWEKIIDVGLWIVDVKHPPRERGFKVGDEVEVLDCGPLNGVEGYIGAIEAAANSEYIISVPRYGRLSFGHHQLRYPIKKEDKVEIKVEGKSKWISRESAIELGLLGK